MNELGTLAGSRIWGGSQFSFSRAFYLPALLALFTACSPSKNSKVSFTIDPIPPSLFSSLSMDRNSSSLRIDDPMNRYSLRSRSQAPWAPDSISSFDCVFVNVMGELIGEWDANKAVVQANPGCGYLGTYSSLISLQTGGTTTLYVTLGSARIIQVVGVRSKVGCSGTLDSTTAAALASYPGMFEVGRAVTDTFQDVDLTINNTYSSSATRDFRCNLGSPPDGTDTTSPTDGGNLAGSPSATSVSLTWSAATDNSTLASALLYKVVQASTTSSINTVANADAATTVTDWTANITSASATGLTTSTAYAFAVLVKDEAGNKSLYTPISVTTGIPDSTAPTVGGSFSGAPGSTTIALAWNAATDNVTAAASLEYKVVTASLTSSINTITLANSASTVQDWTANITSYSVTGLTQEVTYAYAVLVRDAAHNMALYTPISVTTILPESTPPTITAGSLSGGTSQTTATLVWTAGTDNSTPASFLQYKIVTGALTTDINTTTLADAATTVQNWTTNIATYTVTGLTAGTTYAYAVLVKDMSSNLSLYTPISLTTSASGLTNAVTIPFKPVGDSATMIPISNYGLNSGFFLNSSYYQLTRGTYDYLLKMNLSGTVDTSFGSRGFQRISTISGAPGSLSNGTNWQVCNGNAYFYWSDSGTYRLYRANLAATPVTITDLSASTAVTTGGVIYDMNCVGTKVVTTWILNGVANCTPSNSSCVAVAAYDTVSATNVNSGNIAQSVVSNIGAPFMDALGSLWLFSFNHWFQLFDPEDLSLGTKQTWHWINNSTYFDGSQFLSANDLLLYAKSGGTNARFWSDSVANLLSLFTSGTATPTFTYPWLTDGENISDTRYCRFGSNYLGYIDSYATYPNYSFRAAVFNQSGTTGVRSSIFNNADQLLLSNSSYYNFYTGRYYLSLACDDLNERGAFAYLNPSSQLVVNLIDATANDTYLSGLATSLGSLYPSFSHSTTTYALNYRISEQASTITVTPTSAQSAATIEVKMNDGSYNSVTSGTSSSSLTLTSGNNTILIRVTAPDATTTRIYTINISNGICAAGYYDDGTHVCVESGTGYFSTGVASTRSSCSNKPGNSQYTSSTATSSTCPWSCNSGYVSDGLSCNAYPNSTLLSCNSNEIAVGVRGRSGSIIDKLGMRCAPFQNGQIIGSTRNGPSYGGTGGSTFNLDGTLDCPAGYAIYTLNGNYGNYESVERTGRLQVRCINLSTGGNGTYIPGPFAYWGSTADLGAFNFECGSSVNPGGSYITGMVIDNQGGSSYVGKILGISCR